MIAAAYAAMMPPLGRLVRGWRGLLRTSNPLKYLAIYTASSGSAPNTRA